MDINGLNFGLGSIPQIRDYKTRSISAENPTGEPGGGGKKAGKLGVGRKGSPKINLEQGKTTIIADIKGPGVIRHIWITVPDKTDVGDFVLRDLILKVYWDDEGEPSIDVPLGDFFCTGFGMRANMNSIPMVVAPKGGMNCYLPMPFNKSARIAIENQHSCEVTNFFYQITYTVSNMPEDNMGYLHAQWRREEVGTRGKDFTILDGVKGKGHYIGTYLQLTSLERYWWGEGEFKFYIDDDNEWPTICGTGIEDYFGSAWCIQNHEESKPYSYSTPFLGYRYYHESAKVNCWFGHNVAMHGLYRWHIMDPIYFDTQLKVTVQQIGYDGKSLFERSDDMAAVAYWYQKEPHAVFQQLLDRDRRRPR